MAYDKFWHNVLIFSLFGLVGACSTDLERNNPRDVKAPVDLQAKGELGGKVTLEGESDFAGTEIKLDGPSKLDISTIADGSFSVNQILPGSYTVTVSQRGWDQVVRKDQEIPIGTSIKLDDIALLLHRAPVTGSISSSDAAKLPVGGSLIILRRTASPRSSAATAPQFRPLGGGLQDFVYQQIARSDGTWEIPDVPAGKYRMRVEKEGAAPVEQNLEVGPEAESVAAAPVELRPLTGAFTITGKLADGTDSDLYTVNSSVTLNLSGFNANQMKLGEDKGDGCAYDPLTTFAATADLNLSSGDGVKTVCVRFVNSSGEETKDLTSQIILDQTAPDLVLFRLNGGVAYTSADSLVGELVGLDATSGLQSIERTLNNGATAIVEYVPSFVLGVTSDGSYIVKVRLRDRAGNVSGWQSATVVRDTAIPAITQLTVNNNNPQAVPGSASVSLSGIDATSLKMKLWVDNEAAATYGPYVTSTSVLIPAVDGPHTVGIKLKDAAGNESAPQTFVLNVDSTPPTFASVSINAGAAATNSTNVQLTLGATGADFVRVSESPTFGTASWQATAGTLAFVLSSGDGTKTVYAQFKDAAGNLGAVISDGILLDTTPPSGVSVIIDNNAAYNTDGAGQFNLAINGLDVNGVTQMKVISTNANNCAGVGAIANAPYNASIVQVYVNAGAGVEDTARVCIVLGDAAGNWSSAVSDTISYDTKSPVAGAPALTINSGAGVTNETAVNATISAIGADEMQLSNDSGFAGANWQAYATSANVLIPSGDGTKTVYVRFRDLAGNTTMGSNDTVMLDQTPPSGISLSGPVAASATTINLSLTGSDINGPVEVRLSENPAFTAATWQTLSALMSYAITTAGDGTKTVYAQLRDAADNQTIVLTHSFAIDTVAPQNPGVQVQQGSIVAAQLVSLILSADGASEVLLSEDPAFGGAMWEPYGLTKSFTLSAGDGGKTIYAKYRDAALNTANAVSTTTTLDTITPTITQFLVNGGVPNATAGAVTVLVQGVDATALQMKLWVDNEAAATYGPYVTSTSVLIPAVDGPHTVGIKLKDAAGNESGAQTFVLNVDSTPPTFASVSINAGAAATNSTNVQLTLGATGADFVRVSESPTFGGASWQATAGTLSFTLSGGDGAKTVYAQFKDAAGNLGAVISDGILLDSTPPSGVSVLIDNNAAYNTDAAGQFNLAINGIDVNGVTQMKVMSTSAVSCAGVGALANAPYNASIVHAYANAGASIEETARVCVTVSDAAGNWSSAVSDTIGYDTKAPTVSTFVLDGGNDLTTALSVTAYTAADAGTTLMKLSTGAGCASGSWEPLSGVKTVSLSEGNQSLSVMVKDAAGNASTCYADQITVDSLGPNTPTITITSAALTNDTSVSLNLSASGANFVEIAEDVGFFSQIYNGATVGSTTVTVSAGDGVKTLYARFSDAAGNQSGIASATLTLDQTPPSGVAVEINAGNAWNTDTAGQFNLGINATDANGVTLIKIMSTNANNCAGVGAIANASYSASIVHAYANAGAGVEETARVCVMVSDAAGNWSSAVSDTIGYDTKSPVAGAPAITLNSGAGVTNQTAVNATMLATGADEMQLSNDSGFAGASWQAYATSANVLIPSGDGTKTVYVRFRDLAGNTTIGSSDTIDLDQTPPSGISLTGPTASNTYSVNLNLSATDAHAPVSVRLSEDPAFASASWSVFGSPRPFTTSSSDGLHTIYAQFRDSVGNLSQTLSHTLSIDTAAPTNPSVSIQQGAYTQTQSITVVLGANGANEVQLSESASFGGASWQPISLTQTFTLSATETTHTVYARYRDLAGNSTGTLSATTILDLTNPNPPSVSINGGASETNSSQVVLSIGSIDADVIEMQLSNSSGFAGAQWQAVTSAITWDLGGGNTVYLRLRDTAGRVSNAGSDSISVDSTPPIFSSLSILQAPTTNTNAVTLNLTASGSPVSMITGNDSGFAGASWQAFNATPAYTLPAGDGFKTLYAQVRDSAGNLSAIQSAIITLDTGAPTSPQVVVDDGAIYSTTLNVTARLAAANATQYCKGEDPGLAVCSWQPMTTSVSHTFTASEGVRTLYVKYRDAGLNETLIVNDSITIDTIDPASVSVTVAEGTLVNIRTINLVLTATDANSLEMMVSNSAAFTGAGWESYVPGKLWTLTAGDGSKTIYFKVRDAAGRIVSATPATIQLDTTPPVSPSFTIDEGAATSGTKVHLTLAATGADTLIVSEDASFAGTSAVAYASALPFTLSSVDGTKTLYVRFADNAGNETVTLQRSIVLDTVAPSSPNISIAEGSYTSSQQINLNLFASGANLMAINETGNFSTPTWQAYSTSLPYTLTNTTNGVRSVYVKFVDNAGNMSGVVSGTIVYDTQAPLLTSLVLAGATVTSTSRAVTAMVVLSGASDIRLSDNAAFAGAAWVAATDTINLYLTGNDGIKIWYVEARDGAGNLAAPVSDSIVLDTTPTQITQMLVNSGVAYANSPTVSVSLTVDSTAAEMEIIDENGVLYARNSFAAATTVTLSSGEGSRTLTARVWDASGNASAVAFDTIWLDTVVPSGSVLVQNGAARTLTDTVTLNLSAIDGGSGISGVKLADTQVALATTTTVPYEASKLWTLSNWQSGVESSRSVWLQAVDNAGNLSPAVSDTIVLDTLAPTGSIAFAATLTNQTLIGLTLTYAADTVDMKLSDGNSCAGGNWVGVATSTLWNLVPVDGVQDVSVRLRDAVGNLSTCYSDSVTFDGTGPTPGSFKVNVGGSSPYSGYTSSSTLTLELTTSDSDCASVEVAEDIGFILPTATSSSCNGSIGYTLANGADGIHSIYMRMLDTGGNIGPITAATVTLDSSGPSAVGGNVYIAEGANSNNALVHITSLVTGADEMQVTQATSCSGSWSSFASSYPFTLTGSDGAKTVSIRYHDLADNRTVCFSRQITLDTTPPTFGAAVAGMEGVSGRTAQTVVWVSLSAVSSDTSEMMVSNFAGFPSAVWQPVTTLFQQILLSGDGTKTVYIKIRDAAGNESAAATPTIALDTTPPPDPAIQVIDVTGDGFALSSSNVELSWSATIDPDVSHFELQRFVQHIDSQFGIIATPSPTAVTYIDDVTQTVGNVHNYRVRAVDDLGLSSAWSNLVQATPFRPITEVTWIREFVGLRYSFPPEQGTFSLQGTYNWEDVTGNTYSRQLLPNAAQWQNPTAFDEYNGVVWLRTANQDNSLVQESRIPVELNVREVLDNVGNVGYYTSLALDSLGKAHISYYDDTNKDLKYATNASGSWVYTILDSVGNVGYYTSLAIDSVGKVHISYYDATNGDLKYATNASGSWVYTTLDNVGDVGWYTSLALDSVGKLHISYYDRTNRDLKYATNQSGSWVYTTLDNVGDVGQFTSLALDSVGKLHISYYDATNGDLKYATNASGSWVYTTLDNVGDVGWYTSLALDSVGKVYISYYDATNSALKYAANASGSWVYITLDALGIMGQFTSLALDSVGKVHISYRDFTYGELRYLRKASDSAVYITLDSGSVGYYPSLALDSLGKAHISYYDTANRNLKYATNVNGSWVYITLDSGAFVGQFTSLALDSAGKVHISHYDSANKDLKYATNASGSWVYSTLDSVGNVGRDCSLAIDSVGKVHISYWDGTNGDLKYATNASGSWVYTTLDSVGNVGRYSSLALDSAGKLHISYYDLTNVDLKYATNASGSWVYTTLDNVGDVGQHTSLAVDSVGKVHVGYYDNTNKDLKYATNASGSWVYTTLDSVGDVGRYSSLALDSAGKLHISYYDWTNGDLKYATNFFGWLYAQSVQTVSPW